MPSVAGVCYQNGLATSDVFRVESNEPSRVFDGQASIESSRATEQRTKASQNKSDVI